MSDTPVKKASVEEKKLTFSVLQSHANELEDKYLQLLADVKKYETEYRALGEKLNATKIESAMSAAEWRGISELAKSVFGKELESKASKEEKPREVVETLETDDKESEKSKL